MMPESPAWPVAAERIQDREKVGGEQWRAAQGPPGRQSRKVTAESSEEQRRDPRRRLPPARPAQRRDPRKRLPPAYPSLKVPMSWHGFASAPLTKTVRFRLVSGTHFLFHLSDSVTPPL